MLTVIYDRHKKDSQLLKSYIERYCRINLIDVEIHIYETIFSMEHACNRFDYDVIFFGISEQCLLDIELIRKISKKYNGELVFVSDTEEYAAEAYRLRATHYFLKTITYKQVCEYFYKLHLLKLITYLEVTCSYQNIRIPEKSIQYVEAYNNKTIVHTLVDKESCVCNLKRDFTIYETLNHVFERLNHRWFIQTYRSYLVNMCYIDTVRNDRIILKCGIEVLVSRARKKGVREQYNQFCYNWG
ncbi:MAG: LytTR family transcriptional regulator DNA-binding domain-containing protein [Lachnospiraceae bacterium]